MAHNKPALWTERPKGSCTSPIALSWCSYSQTVRFMPHNYLAADLTHIDASLWGREDEIGRLIAESPAMLALLQQVHRRGYMFDHDAALWGEIGAILERIKGSN